MRVPHPRASEPSEAPHRSHKNTRRWCRGKVGRLHTPVVVVPDNTSGWSRTCRAITTRAFLGVDRSPIWYCSHRLVCDSCGKVLKFFVSCPDRPTGIRQAWLPEDEQ